MTSDLAFAGVDGPRTGARRVLGCYVDRLHAAAEHDAALGTAFMRVAGLVDPPSALLRPRVVVSVLRPRRPRLLGADLQLRAPHRPLLRWNTGGIMRSHTSLQPGRTR